MFTLFAAYFEEREILISLSNQDLTLLTDQFIRNHYQLTFHVQQGGSYEFA